MKIIQKITDKLFSQMFYRFYKFFFFSVLVTLTYHYHIVVNTRLKIKLRHKQITMKLAALTLARTPKVTHAQLLYAKIYQRYRYAVLASSQTYYFRDSLQ